MTQLCYCKHSISSAYGRISQMKKYWRKEARFLLPGFSKVKTLAKKPITDGPKIYSVKNKKNSYSLQSFNYILQGIWWPNFHVIEEALLDPSGDMPSENTRAELLRGSRLLFALDSALRAHPHIHIHFSAQSLSAFFTLLHQSVPKLFPHFGEFPRLISWQTCTLGLITLAWTLKVCPVWISSNLE